MIGKLEELVLLATLKTGSQALPSQVFEQVVAGVVDGGREASFGAIYTTLTRMASKGLITESKVTDSSGRQRRAFTVNAAGRNALSQSVSSIRNLGGFALAGG